MASVELVRIMEKLVSGDLVMSMIKKAKENMAPEEVDCETNCDSV